LLLVIYLRCQLLDLKAQEMTAYRVWRDVSWMRDGTVPSKLLKDRSLMRQLGRLRSRNSSLQISQRRRECIKVGILKTLTSDHAETRQLDHSLVRLEVPSLHSLQSPIIPHVWNTGSKLLIIDECQ
jgi:hypothetical protein